MNEQETWWLLDDDDDDDYYSSWIRRYIKFDVVCIFYASVLILSGCVMLSAATQGQGSKKCMQGLRG